MRVGAVSIKHWDGAHQVHSVISNQIPGKSSTGGVPTRPSRVDMYQYQCRFVANDWSKQLCVPIPTTHGL